MTLANTTRENMARAFVEGLLCSQRDCLELIRSLGAEISRILLIGGGVVDKTSFSVPKVLRRAETSGRVYVNGIVSGTIHGAVSGYLRGSVDGDVNLNLLSGSVAGDGGKEAADDADKKA